MTQPTAQRRQQAASRIAVLLASGATATALAPPILTSLAALGISSTAAQAALTLTTLRASTVLPLGPASRATAASENYYRAAYLVAASERIQSRLAAGQSRLDAIKAERPILTAHLAAKANRRTCAQAVDRAAQQHGSMLGWSARMDANTSAECRRANGKNFSVYQRPLIGWPGTVHPHCHCRPVAPFSGAGLVDQVATQAERREAVA